MLVSYEVPMALALTGVVMLTNAMFVSDDPGRRSGAQRSLSDRNR